MTDQEIKEAIADLVATQKRTELQMERTDRKLERLGEQMGFWGRSLGDVVELMVVPGILEKMNTLGHCFTRIGPNKIYYKDNKTFTEVDLLMENGEEAMAVEIKTDLRVKWINDHLKRLKLLRKNEKITGLKGKDLYAAVAGISINKEAREFALKNGMYVINIAEDKEKLEVTAPKKDRIGRW